MCDALHYLLYNIFIRFGSKLYRQIVGIPMGTNCVPLVANWFLFCSEREPWVCLQFVIVVFPDHTHLLVFIICPFSNLLVFYRVCSIASIDGPYKYP